MEVRRKKLQLKEKRGKRAAALAAKKAKKKKKTGGMFGETIGGDGGFFDGPGPVPDDKAEDAV